MMTEQAVSIIVKSYQSLACQPAAVHIYIVYAVYTIAQYFKVTHDYIFPSNARVHHFVGRRGVGGVPILFNSMKLHYGLPSERFARNTLKKKATLRSQ